MRRTPLLWCACCALAALLAIAPAGAAPAKKNQAKPPAAANKPAPPSPPSPPAPEQAQEKEQELSRLTEEERVLHKDMARAADEIAALEKQVRAAEAELNKALGEEKRLRRQLGVLEQQQQAKGKNLGTLLAGLWPVHVQNLAHAGGNLESWDEADRQFTWLARVYDVAAQGIVELDELKAPMEEGLAAHQAVVDEARGRLKEVNSHKDELVAKKVAFDTRMAALRKEKRSAEEDLKAVLAAVKSVNYTLERKLEAETSVSPTQQAESAAKDAPTDSSLAKGPAKPAQPAQSAQSGKADKPGASPAEPAGVPVASAGNVPAELARLSMDRLKGRLPWPVAGGVVAKTFKPEGNPPVRGVALRVADGAPVQAVAAGKVVHDDTLRGFGRVVILMHGDDYFSLYAYLAESKVKMGQELAMGDQVGRSGFYPEIKGPGLYFELRFHQKAINPETWLAARK